MVRKSGTSAAVRSVARGAVGVLKLVNFEVQKVQNPNLFDLTVNEVFLYTILAFRKHMSLLWANLLHCLISVEKCGLSARRKQNFVILSLVLTVEKVPGSWQEKSKHNQA